MLRCSWQPASWSGLGRPSSARTLAGRLAATFSCKFSEMESKWNGLCLPPLPPLRALCPCLGARVQWVFTYEAWVSSSGVRHPHPPLCWSGGSAAFSAVHAFELVYPPPPSLPPFRASRSRYDVMVACAPEGRGVGPRLHWRARRARDACARRAAPTFACGTPHGLDHIAPLPGIGLAHGPATNPDPPFSFGLHPCPPFLPFLLPHPPVLPSLVCPWQRYVTLRFYMARSRSRHRGENQ